MSKFWIRFWWFFTAMALIGMFVIWLLPEPVSEGDASQEERALVVERISKAQSELPQLKFTKVKAHGNRVIELNATWIAQEAPHVHDRQAWGQQADAVALMLAQKYVPEGWQVNVALWYKRLPRGIAGRTAGTDPQGGPAHLFRDGKTAAPVK